jgi:hypothetical protein
MVQVAIAPVTPAFRMANALRASNAGTGINGTVPHSQVVESWILAK